MARFDFNFTAVPTDLVCDKNISHLEFRILCVLMSKSNDGYNSYLGYSRIAEYVGCSRRVAITNINNLLSKGYITLTQRNHDKTNANLSSCIHLNFDELPVKTGMDSDSSSTRGGVAGITRGGDDISPSSDSRSTRLVIQESPYQDLNKQDLNINKKYNKKKFMPSDSNSTRYIEPADVTAGRTMPNSGCAGSARKEGRAEGAQLDIEDYCLWQDFKLDFSGCYPWLQLVRVQNHLLIRGLGRMGEDILVKAWDEVKAWFAARGVVVEKVGQSQRFSGEIIIKEAV